MDPLVPDEGDIHLFDVPFGERWEILKPTIERLYIREGLKLPQLIEALRVRYGFDARQVLFSSYPIAWSLRSSWRTNQRLTRLFSPSESQYKYQINRKWKLKKSIPAPKKIALCETIQSRARLGKQTTATYKGQDVDTKKLRRHLKTQARRDISLRAAAHGLANSAPPVSGHTLQFGNLV
jgi:hypothetical protein